MEFEQLPYKGPLKNKLLKRKVVESERMGRTFLIGDLETTAIGLDILSLADEGFTYEQIGERLGVTPAFAKETMAYIRSRNFPESSEDEPYVSRDDLIERARKLGVLGDEKFANFLKKRSW